MAVDKLFGNLTSEQREKAKQCKSPEEFLKLAGAEGIDLTDEQMEAISGGGAGRERLKAAFLPRSCACIYR